MKNIIPTLVMSFISIICHANDWQEQWEKGIEYCGNKQYEAAENKFNLAIASLEANDDDTHPHVYVDRARLYFLQDRYIESLTDLNKAISSKYLTNNDKIRGLVTRIYTCINLQMNEQALSDYETFKAMSPNFPKVEFSKEKIIIRNIPKSDCYKRLAKAFLISSEICEKESDIKEYDSGIIIAKRKALDCGCGCKEKRQAEDDLVPSDNLTSIDSCKYWCDKCALIGMAWCAKVFKRWDCQTGCIFAVDLIKDGCHWCCSTGNFYKKCIKPFEDIISYMGQPCDPYWD